MQRVNGTPYYLWDRPIIIEGADGSGKSTLIKQQFPGAIHAGGPPKTSEELLARLDLPVPGNVYDRWTAISEQIYGPIIHGRNLLSTWYFDQAIMDKRPMFIYCRPPTHVMKMNLKAQIEKPHKNPEFIEQVCMKADEIRAAYDDLMLIDLPTRLGAFVLTYDYTGGIYNDI